MAELPATSITAETVAARGGLRGASAAAESARCLALAIEELGEALAGRFRDPGPQTWDEMVLRVAVDAARASRVLSGSGAQSSQVEDGQQRPAPRDPLAGVRPRLARYVVGFG